MVGHECAAMFGRTATCTQNGGEQRDETAIGTGVGTAKCREKISGDWELGRGTIFERIELNEEKYFEMKFLVSDLFWMNFTGVADVPHLK